MMAINFSKDAKLKLNTGISPSLNYFKEADLCSVFSSPLSHKEKHTKISKDTLLVKKEPNSKNIFTEKDTLQKKFSYIIVKQEKYNNKLGQYLLYNNKIPYFEKLIFVKDKVKTSKSLANLQLNKTKNIDKKEYYQLTLEINKFLFILRKFRMDLKYHSFIRNPLLFLPKRFLVRQPDVRYTYMLRYLKKTSVFRFKKVLPNLNQDLHTNPTEELKEQSVVQKRNKKINILHKKLITELLKQGIILILNLKFLIKNKKMDIINLISLENINNIEPAFLQKISNSKITAPYPSNNEGAPNKWKTKKFKSELEFELNKLNKKRKVGPLALLRSRSEDKGKNLNNLFNPTFPSTKSEEGVIPPFKGEGQGTSRRAIMENLEFEAPKLTNLPFSLLFYNNNEIFNPTFPSTKPEGAPPLLPSAREKDRGHQEGLLRKI